jgi:hypothetical protein
MKEGRMGRKDEVNLMMGREDEVNLMRWGLATHRRCGEIEGKTEKDAHESGGCCGTKSKKK